MPARILVVDDVPSSRFITSTRLAMAYYDVIEAASGAEALDLARTEQPDLILLDIVMPGMDGFEVCRRLKADPAVGHLPVVMLSALDDRESRLRGFDCGSDDFLTRPVRDAALLARVRSLTRVKMLTDELRQRAGPAHAAVAAAGADLSASRLLIVDADRAAADALAGDLAGRLGLACRIAEGEGAARAILEAGGIDAVLIGPRLADGEPMRLASAIRGRRQTRGAVVMMTFAAGDTGHPALAADLGVSDYLTEPVDRSELAVRLRTQLRQKLVVDGLRRTLDARVEMAVTDPLTGLNNRHFSDARLVEMVARATALGLPLVLMILDLDDFKQINDRHGHAAGDAVLGGLAARLRASVRDADLLARIGGEEFLIAMPDLPARAAEAVAERIRNGVETPHFPTGAGGAPVALTVSIGIAHHARGEPAEALFRRADRALYLSKAAGRNRVTVARG